MFKRADTLQPRIGDGIRKVSRDILARFVFPSIEGVMGGFCNGMSEGPILNMSHVMKIS